MTKPRLSMKLLWEFSHDFKDKHKETDMMLLVPFLMFVDEQMKSVGERQRTPTTTKETRSL